MQILTSVIEQLLDALLAMLDMLIGWRLYYNMLIRNSYRQQIYSIYTKSKSLDFSRVITAAKTCRISNAYSYISITRLMFAIAMLIYILYIDYMLENNIVSIQTLQCLLSTQQVRNILNIAKRHYSFRIFYDAKTTFCAS